MRVSGPSRSIPNRDLLPIILQLRRLACVGLALFLRAVLTQEERPKR